MRKTYGLIFQGFLFIFGLIIKQELPLFVLKFYIVQNKSWEITSVKMPEKNTKLKV